LKAKQICQVTPYVFDSNLIISLDGKWIQVFQEIPTFTVSIDETGRLNLCTTKSVNHVKKTSKQFLEAVA